jgi:T5SS/PEP-CTERM-associated repeat protein/autotransporter-associated beta strand protein
MMSKPLDGKRRSAFAAFLLLTIALPCAVNAQTSWTNAGTGDWFTDTNWSSGVPTVDDDATIDNAGTAQVSSGEADAQLLTVGHGGIGSLTIDGGGALFNAAAYIGELPGSTGTAIVDGPGSSWTQASNFIIGGGGSGALTVRNGGVVRTTAVYVAGDPNGSGSLLVDGQGSGFAASSQMHVGYYGAANMFVQNGAVVASLVAMVGRFATSQAMAVVDGNGSAWNVQGNLYVGEFGNGSATVRNGGTVRSIGATSKIVVADSDDSVGTFNIGDGADAGTVNTSAIEGGTGAATLNFNHAGAIAFDVPMTGSLAVNQIGAGETALTAASTYTGPTSVSGGALIVEGSLGNTSTSVTSGATLAGNGSIGGPVGLHSGGTIAPGNLVGTLNATSLDWNGDGVMTFALGADDADSDRLALSGALSKQGSGSYRFDFSDAAVPPVLRTYTLITFTSSSGFSAGDFNYSYTGTLLGLAGTFELTPTALLFHVSSLPVELQLFSVD